MEMKIETAKHVHAFVDRVREKAHHHAKQALPLIAPLTLAAIGVADEGSIRTPTTQAIDRPGLQLRFSFGGAKFKLRWHHNVGERFVGLHQIFGSSEGPMIVAFRNTDGNIDNTAEPRLRAALLANRKQVAA